MQIKRKRITLFVLFIMFLLSHAVIAEAMPVNTQSLLSGWKEKYSHIYEIEFSQDFNLSGLFDQSNTTFHLGEWDIKEAVLVLKYNASQFLNQEVSYFTVSINNQPAATYPITQNKEEITELEIPLPVTLFQSGGINGVKIDTYLRGQTTDACVDDASISSWMNVFEESTIQIAYEPLSPCTNIAQFYEKLTSIESHLEGESMVGTAKDASESVLTAMSYALTGIGGNAKQDYENLHVGFLDEAELKKYSYVLYFSKFDKLPEFLLLEMTEKQMDLAKKDAVVCLLDVKVKGKREITKVLLVTGSDDDAIINAGIMFTNPDYMKQLGEKDKKVTTKESFLMPENKTQEYINLTPFGQQVNGNFEQKLSFGVDYPANRTIAQSSQLSLDFRYSQELNFDKSLITIYINGIPIGSRALSKEGADGRTEVFDIPTSLKISGSFTVEIVFNLYPEEEWCELTPENIPWGFVENTSMLKLMSIDKTDLFFEHFPSPFLRDGMLNNLLLILPAQPKDSDIEVMGKLLCMFGRYLKSNAGDLKVAFASNSLSLEKVNIISIGEEGRNLLRISNSKLLIDSSFEKQAGIMQLLYSSYGETVQGILIISGKSAEGMKKTIYYLGSVEHLWELKGDIAVTDGKDLYYAYQKEPESELAPEWPVEKKEESAQEKDTKVLIAAIMVLTVVAGTMLGIKYWRSKD